ncbi:MAG: DUF4389 domain-containing protein [Acidimicrobiaceae bacterium]|nr:DUF4389 domain-containing protein [Acidimicrobiaceae bacterium]
MNEHDATLLSASRVLVGFASEPPDQARLTILLRVFLAIPVLIWSIVLSIAALFAVVISWFAALFTGRVPLSLQAFNTAVLRYVSEVQAYTSVLVKRWPGFALEPAGAVQVSLQIDQCTLNRGAVLLRYFLALPAGAVFFVVSFASYALSVVVWISALILGRPAKALYQARLLCLRYEVRYVAYMFMLTPTQPFAGLFGDRVAPGLESLQGPPPGLSTRIHASSAARLFLIASLLVGAYGGVLYAQRVGNLQNLINSSVVVPLVNSTETNVVAQLNTYVTSLSACAVNSSAVCGTNAAVVARDAIATQLYNLNADATFVITGKNEYLAYVGGLQKINTDFSRIAADLTWAQQQNDIVTSLRPDILAFDAQYQKLRAAI